MVPDLIVVPVLFVSLGIAGLYTGWKRRRIHARMTALTPTPVEALSPPGPVEIQGTGTPVDDLVTAPITGRPAVLAAWTIEEWDERGDTSRWREVARGIEAAAFGVDDGSGSVPVGPLSKRETAGRWTQTAGVSATNGVRIDDVLAEFTSFTVEAELGPAETPPVEIRRLHRDHGLDGAPDPVTDAADVDRPHGTRRYTQGVLAPGDWVYVLGRVEERDGTASRPESAIVTTPRDGPLLVSDREESTLESTVAAAARTWLVAGTVSSLVGLAGLAALL
ncbi:E3 ubiquitin ligase family protein [Haloplanus pelagicus]|uniref:E3 ubiquitin ligase family protein n=1 Tax=Haloplanus pelagicus TaxID=2949995 RepID=UPI00203FB394|nr:E3 ubiquitin ligase family protein [Haloplanus sp. HW8-1]